MRLQFSNIGMIEKANVKVGKLTILTGENDSGKSTIGKLLYALVNGILNLNSTFEKYKSSVITKNLDEIQKRIDNSERWQKEEEKAIMELFDGDRLDVDVELGIISLIKQEINKNKIDNLVTLTKKLYLQIEKYIEVKEVESFLEKIEEAFKYTKENDMIRKSNLIKSLNLEFNGQINNLFVEDNRGNVKIQYQNLDIFSVEIFDNLVKEIKEYKTLYANDIVYLETPFIFNMIKEFTIKSKKNELKDHNEKLIELILNSKEKGSFNPLEEALFSEKLNGFEKMINTQLIGEVKFSSQKQDFVLVREGKEILLSNTAMGIKSMALLSILLKSKFFDKDNILIIDEPEVHLHPKWQIEYAKIIVALAKEFDTKIIITSHSPYFIEAIQKFSEHFEIRDETNFYMLEKKDEKSVTSTVRDVNDSLEEVYEKLGEAYKKLDDLTLGDL